MRIVFAIGLAACAAGMSLSLSVLPAKAQYPLGQSGSFAPPVPPSLDRALDCLNPRDASLCAELDPKRRTAGPLNILPAPQQAAPPSPARLVSEEAPVTNCDIYAASDSDPNRKAKGVPYDKVNSALAIPACESAVRQYPNSIRLIFQLGRAYNKNNDFRSALVQYRKAADQGHAIAQFNLGLFYEKALGVAKDDAQAVVWYRKAAEQGFVPAQANLGNMYRNGQGVPQDYAEALKWLRKAAAQGDARALNILGVMYATGQGVVQDYAEAITWFHKAADQGSAEAQTSLARMYRLGEGVPQNVAEAVKWLRKAADQGNADAQFLLGLLYEDGDGGDVPRDYAEALKWYGRADAQGNVDAKSKFAALNTRLREVQPGYNNASAEPNQMAAAIIQLRDQLNERNEEHNQLTALPVSADTATNNAGSKPSGGESGIVWAIIAFAIFFYFLPTIVALRREHHNAGAIFVFNLFLGWTFLGWVLALVWACTRPAYARPQGP